MLAIPLVRLEREGSLEIRAEMPPDDPSWEGTELRFSSPLSVSGRAQEVSSGEVVVRIRLQGVLEQECRRCLEPVTVPVDEDVDLVFAPVEEGDESGVEHVRPLPPGLTDLELGGPIREEIVLSQSLLVVCKDECRGLCPQCGVNLNEDRCQCRTEEEDPRWDALRALADKRE
jgi:uncharacterized protein